MEEALERMFLIYQQMTGAEVSDELRSEGTAHVRELFEAGETNSERLTVKGLTFLKQAA